MNKLFSPTKTFFLILLSGLFTLSCNDDDDGVNPESDMAVNNWIYDVMKEVYYWTDNIPGNVNKNQDPIDFFYSLVYPQDRFSVIVPDYDALINSLNGVNKEAGYEYILSYVERGSDDIIGIILYVKPNSPADAAGLKRGDIIEKINGQLINDGNYEQLLSTLSSTHSLSVLRQNEGSGLFEAIPPIELNAVAFKENPNFLDTVYTVEGRKIAYYVYNFFSDGVDSTYDEQMDQIFAEFKSEGVTDLILDLRYNSGGAISSATNLASLIGTNVGPDKIFYENRWNDFYQNYIENRDDGEEILRTRFLEKAENIGSNLSRIYVLTGSRTASASELIINGLRPYMDVFTIGEKTVGKNVGSIPISDTENSSNHYGLLPIAFKIFNSQGESDYDEGFVPDVLVEELDYPLKPLGDIEETLLAEALSIITNAGSIVGREKPRVTKDWKPIMSSIDQKARTNRLILNLNGKH